MAVLSCIKDQFYDMIIFCCNLQFRLENHLHTVNAALAWANGVTSDEVFTSCPKNTSADAIVKYVLCQEAQATAKPHSYSSKLIMCKIIYISEFPPYLENLEKVGNFMSSLESREKVWNFDMKSGKVWNSHTFRRKYHFPCKI